MVIDQTNVLESLSRNSNQDAASKGIGNYIKNDILSSGIFSQGAFSGKIENYVKTDKSGTAMTVSSVNMADATYQKPFGEDEENTLADTFVKMEGTSAEDRKNQMAVLANITSPEDLQEMEKDGFSIMDSDSHTIITETDKIKAVLAKAGVDISIYGDDLSIEELAGITGSMTLAQQIESQLKENDLPVTQENTADMAKAYAQAISMNTITEDAIAYMMKNHLAPTIDNLYRAQFCGQNTSMAYQKEQGISEADLTEMQEQMRQIVEAAGITADEDTMKICNWLIKNDIAVTGDHISYAKKLQELGVRLQELTMDSDKADEDSIFLVKAMAQAIAEGKRPEDAMIVEGYSLIDRAEDAMKIIMQTTTGNLEYCVQKGMIINIHNLATAQNVSQNTGFDNVLDLNAESDFESISGKAVIWAGNTEDLNTAQTNQNTAQIAVVTAQRQLAEIRLTMTVSANYALLKKGIAIDIQPLEQLVKELKDLENQYYRDLLQDSGIEASEENVQTFADTTIYLQMLKTQPAYILSPVSADENIRTMHIAGNAMQQAFEKAKQTYETLMTQPNEDYNDDISKAFTNIDDILKDLELDISKANQRAVRILAYNETEITVETIQKVKAADEQVQRTFSNMTPAVTLEMIRRNINPLDMSITQLNAIAEEIKKTTQDSNERFSKFLWKLEKNNEITELERTSYIGIYRLIAQVEKTDGAVIGSLLNQGADITMRNLLQAVRSKNKGSMDYVVDDKFGSVKTTIIGEKIDQQIEAAYQFNCLRDVMENISPEKVGYIFGENWQDMTPEQLKNAFQDSMVGDVDELIETGQNTETEMEYDYAQEQSKDLSEAAFTREEVFSFMERYGIDNSMANIFASAGMLHNSNTGFRTLFDKEDLPEDAADKIEQMKETVLERFGEAVKTPQEMADAQETLAEVAEHAMDTMIMEKETISVADLKRLRLMNSQFQICAKKAREESFLIPVQTGEGITGISLKIVRGKEEKGLVDIFFRGALKGKVAATFNAKENGISGTIAVSDEETRKVLLDQLGKLAGMINEEGKESVDLHIALIPDISSEKFEMSSLRREERMQSETEKDREKGYKEDEQKEEKNPVQTKRLYHIAESFIQLIGELTN